MLIAHVTFVVNETDCVKALGILSAEVSKVQAMKGCIAFIPFQSATDPTQIGVIHEWETSENFAAYTSSEVFAHVGETLRPLMLAPPVSRRFDATLIKGVN